VHDVLALGKVGEAHASRVEPLLPRLEVCELRLDLVVLDDAPLRGVDEEHAAGRRRPRRLMRSGAKSSTPVSLPITMRPSVVSVQRPGRRPLRSSVAPTSGAVGEDQRGRAVPRLHLHRVVLVERAQLRVDVDLLLVRLGHHHHDRVRQAAPGQREQLEHLVERRRVARPFVQIGSSGRMSPSSSDSSCDWRARIQLRLPLTVLISPLCAACRSGCASGQDGKVLVE
jgi:hypothetical protein